MELVNHTSAEWPPDEDEWTWAGLAGQPSRCVAPERVAGAPAAFECRLVHTLALGNGTMFFGEVAWFHVAAAVLEGHRVNVRALDPVARLGGPLYTPLGEVFQLVRPDWEQLRDGAAAPVAGPPVTPGAGPPARRRRPDMAARPGSSARPPRQGAAAAAPAAPARWLLVRWLLVRWLLVRWLLVRRPPLRWPLFDGIAVPAACAAPGQPAAAVPDRVGRQRAAAAADVPRPRGDPAVRGPRGARRGPVHRAPADGDARLPRFRPPGPGVPGLPGRARP